MGFNIAILISGNGSNMLNIVEACKKKILSSKVKVVISNNKKSQGIIKAKNENIKSLIIEDKNIEILEKKIEKVLINEKINLICLAGFMRILSESFLKNWEKRIINIHPSILPKFKGLNAINQALKKRAKFSGCTVHFVDKGIDTGKIIDQRIVKISNDDDESSLRKKILKQEHILYIKVILKLEKESFNV